jgi:hypothetical protein
MADGYRDDGNKQLSHAFEAASIGTLVASPFIIKYEKEKWGWYIGTYACLRYTVSWSGCQYPLTSSETKTG